jgi:hypothetical protein
MEEGVPPPSPEPSEEAKQNTKAILGIISNTTQRAVLILATVLGVTVLGIGYKLIFSPADFSWWRATIFLWLYLPMIFMVVVVMNSELRKNVLPVLRDPVAGELMHLLVFNTLAFKFNTVLVLAAFGYWSGGHPLHLLIGGIGGMVYETLMALRPGKWRNLEPPDFFP